MQGDAFGKMMSRRCAGCYFVICVMFALCALRVGIIATGKTTSAGNTSAYYTLTVTRPRGTLYDRNGIPLNNRRERIIAAVSPSMKAVAALRSVLGNSPVLTGLLERLGKGYPVLCELPRMVECEGIVCTVVKDADTSDKPAVHMIGYTDSSGHGATGLEAAFDSLLYSEQTVDAVFELSGNGSVLGGKAPEIRGADIQTAAVYTTLDSAIQRVAEESCSGIASGAAAVCEIGTGRICAAVSKPGFDCTSLSDYLNREDAPLLNRLVSAYSVDSVFKPCVAAAGIEQGCAGLSFNCTGSIKLDGRDYHCHKRTGHGLLSLGGAISESCNTFFYQFAAAAGADAVYEKMTACSFGSAFEIAPNFKNAAGKIPEKSSLYADAALANLSIGQGSLLLSPVSMLTLYCAIASDGGYYLPHIVEKTVNAGKTERYDYGRKTVVMKPETAAMLREYLRQTIASGTGTAAKTELCTAAGKTATAQTGRFDETGKEINIGWFCGYFPAENPKYAVVVMEENANGYNAAPVFAAIADGITALENGQPEERQITAGQE